MTWDQVALLVICVVGIIGAIFGCNLGRLDRWITDRIEREVAAALACCWLCADGVPCPEDGPWVLWDDADLIEQGFTPWQITLLKHGIAIEFPHLEG